jgi:hypothetical protein
MDVEFCGNGGCDASLPRPLPLHLTSWGWKAFYSYQMTQISFHLDQGWWVV